MKSEDTDRRIYEHPILGPLKDGKKCVIIVDGKPIEAREGEPILAAMLAAGIVVARQTEKRHEPRGLFCGIGLCSDCLVTVNGVRNVRSCVTLVEDGMRVETQAPEAAQWG